MNGLIQKLLRKKGVQNLEELDTKKLPDGTPSEKEVFEQWQAVLNKESLSTQDIKTFCEQQIRIIEAKWKDYDKENSKKAELIPFFIVYKTLLEAIDSPKSAREALEKYLNQLLQS